MPALAVFGMLKPDLKISLPELYDEDETAWLEEMSRILSERRFHELDAENLSEYLLDMSRRDKREVLSRLTKLLVHLLKSEHQTERRSNSWRATIASQRNELKDLLESKTLLNHAAQVLGKAYGRAVKQAALEAGFDEQLFPAECPFSLNHILGDE